VRKERLNGKVKLLYVGVGPAAEQAAAEDAARYAQFLATAAQRKQEKQEWNTLQNDLRRLSDTVTTLMDGTLIAADYYRHQGTWTRRRHAKNSRRTQA